MVAMIFGFIALGLIALTIIALTVKWIIDKIKGKKALGYIKKVMVADIRDLANSCDNTITLDQLDELSNKGYTHVMADKNIPVDLATTPLSLALFPCIYTYIHIHTYLSL